MGGWGGGGVSVLESEEELLPPPSTLSHSSLIRDFLAEIGALSDDAFCILMSKEVDALC